MAKKPYPTFASEAEEAAWLYEHQDELEDYFDVPTPEQAEAMRRELAGLQRTPKAKLAELDARVRAKTEPISLRVPTTDLDRAKLIAAKKGIGYQTLLKMAIHEWLDDEERQRA